MSGRVPLFQVDAFTATVFSGNPAAVCVLEQPATDAWMQRVAAEMNLPETAFLQQAGDDLRLRWFTPTVEVDLCGHATLASAHVLWEIGRVAPAAMIRFHTRSGVLTARRRGPWIEIDFPATPALVTEPPPDLLAALAVAPKFVGRTDFDYLVEVADAATVRALRPDLRRLGEVATRGVMVTSLADDPAFDFVSRFFAPAAGIDEDPVTGSAHCALAPFWAARLHKRDLVAYQASARGGIVRARLDRDCVVLGGQAVTVLRGELV